MTRRSRTTKLLPEGRVTDFMLAPAVMMSRLPILAAEARDTSGSHAETIRAVTEKAGATMEGLVAAQLSLAHAALAFWPDLLSGRLPTLLSGKAAQLATDAALKPAGKLVRANFRRLSKSTG